MAGASKARLAGFEAFSLATWLNVWSGLIGVLIAVAAVWLGAWRSGLAMVGAPPAVQWRSPLGVRKRAAQEGIAIDLRASGGSARSLAVLAACARPGHHGHAGDWAGRPSWSTAARLSRNGALSAANQVRRGLVLPGALGGRCCRGCRSASASPIAGARKVLRAAVAMNAAVVVPIVVAGIASARGS